MAHRFVPGLDTLGLYGSVFLPTLKPPRRPRRSTLETAILLLQTLPESRIAALLPILEALQPEELIDEETAARLDAALADPGPSLTHEQLLKELQQEV